MHRNPRHTRPTRRTEGPQGPGAAIVVASVVAALAIVAVMALPVFVKPPESDSRPTPARNPWDGTNGRVQQGLDSIERGTRFAIATQRHPDPVATVRDESMRYTAARLAEIKTQLDAIDAIDWQSAADLERRDALVREQSRLLRY